MNIQCISTALLTDSIKFESLQNTELAKPALDRAGRIPRLNIITCNRHNLDLCVTEKNYGWPR